MAQEVYWQDYTGLASDSSNPFVTEPFLAGSRLDVGVPVPAWQSEGLLAQVPQATDKVESAKADAPDPLNKHEERQKLEALANTGIKGRDARRMVEDLNSFERRAQSGGLSDQQVAETYKQVGRVLSAGTSAYLPEGERLKIAQQIIRNAARPTSIDQGKHGTCNVAVVESRMYTRNPEAAAKLVADVATTGSFITADGFTITPTRRSLMPDEESRNNPPSDGQRGAASHIFQVTAANVKWQRTVVTPDGQISSWGKIVYEQIPNKRSRFSGDSGERVMDYNVNPPRETTDYKRGPALSVSDLVGISNQITGKAETDFVIENKVHGGHSTTHVSSPKELETAILNAGKNMPIFIRVHTGNDPFMSDSSGSFSRQRGVWHVVCITGYDPKTQKVSIDNQWGSRSDRTVDIEKLYKSTMEPGTDEWKKKHEFFIVPGIRIVDPLNAPKPLLPDQF